MTKICIFFSLALFSLPASAAYVSGFELNKWGEARDRINSGRASTTDYQDAASLYGYVTGVHDTLDGIAFCVPSEAKAGQLQAVVQKYVKEHPERWNESANMLVSTPLRIAFPCKQK